MAGLFGSVQFLTSHIGNESLRSANAIKRVAASGDPVKQASIQGQGAGDVSFAANMLNRSASKRSSINAFQNAVTYMQAQADGLRQAEKIYQRMLDLASLAVDPMLNDNDRAMLSHEFESLRTMAVEINSQTIGGANLFDMRAATTQYATGFTDGATQHDTPTGGIKNDGTFVPGAIDDGSTAQPYWDVQKNVIYNSGEVTLELKPLNVWDRFILYQDDPSNYIFDTGEWQGTAWDKFVVKYGPDRDTTFVFTTTSPSTNKHRYLPKFGLTDDLNGNSGMDAYYNKELSNLGQVTTNKTNSATTLLTLRVIGESWNTGYELDVNYKNLQMDDAFVGRSQDLQVALNPLGLGALHEQDSGFPKLAIDTRQNALKAVDNITNEINGFAQQIGNLSSNMNRVGISMDAAQAEVVTHEEALSGVVREDLALQMLKVTKARIARSQNAAMLSQAINLNYDIANMIL